LAVNTIFLYWHHGCFVLFPIISEEKSKVMKQT
jgi:hypothetical protein